MQVLGIESSCDETAAAVVAEVDDPARPWQIRSSVVASQVEIHREWGGVVPELASRQHVRDICGVVEKALGEAGIELQGNPKGSPYGGNPKGSPYGGNPEGSPYGGNPKGSPYGGNPEGSPYGGNPSAFAQSGFGETSEDPPYDCKDNSDHLPHGDTIDAIAVTQGPGLVGSLLVGLQFAKSLAASWGVPLVPVHHLAGHIESLFLHNGPLPLPAVVLVVSGGHTNLYVVPEAGVYRPIARTRDDAAGEAYDKVAKLLGLGYPGGPIIDRLSREGNDRAIPFPMTRITHRDRNAPGEAGRLDFSFSGIKTAVLRYVRQAEGGEAASRDGGATGAGERPASRAGGEAARPGSGPFTGAEIADICASFQRVVVETLVDRTFEAAWRYGAKSVGIAGGVSANSRLRKDAAARGEQLSLPVFVPSLALTTDNAAMIAAAGLRRYRQGITAGWDLNAEAGLRLT